MEVSELVGLAEWVESRVPSVRDEYQNLLTILQHNASQSDKRPLEAELSRLEGAQVALSFDELSLQQIRVLERLDLRQYLGREGVSFVDEAVRTANYDPATAVSRVQAVVTNIDNARNNLNAYERVT